MAAPTEPDLLRRLARRYLWWEPVERAVLHPDRVIAQVMSLRDWDDVIAMTDCFGGARLAAVLQSAGPGAIDVRSWHYWHYRLGLAKVGDVPALPMRKLP